MRKVLFIPKWGYSWLDLHISDMECKGWRLEEVKYFCLYYFKKTSPRPVQYFCTFSYPKEYEIFMVEYELRRETGANLIPMEYSGWRNIHRITKLEQDLSEFKRARKLYSVRCLIHELLTLVIMWGLFIFISTNALAWIRICIWVLAIISVGYALTGLAVVSFERVGN